MNPFPSRRAFSSSSSSSRPTGPAFAHGPLHLDRGGYHPRRNANLWRTRDPAATGEPRQPAGAVCLDRAEGRRRVGALGWYLIFVINFEKIKPAPDSWTALWDPSRKDAWGLNGGGGASLLFEVASATYFGGTEILNTEAGILKVLDKIAELKPNTKLGVESEGTMQTALENGEVEGVSISPTSPPPWRRRRAGEGGLSQGRARSSTSAAGCQPSASTKVAEADAFIPGFSARPRPRSWWPARSTPRP